MEFLSQNFFLCASNKFIIIYYFNNTCTWLLCFIIIMIFHHRNIFLIVSLCRNLRNIMFLVDTISRCFTSNCWVGLYLFLIVTLAPVALFVILSLNSQVTDFIWIKTSCWTSLGALRLFYLSNGLGPLFVLSHTTHYGNLQQ